MLVVRTLFTTSPPAFLLAGILLIIVAYATARYSPTLLHPFVWAMVFGMALQIPLSTLTADSGTLVRVLELLAAFVLFAAGLSVPVKNFQKYFAPIAALSVIGTVLTVVLFAFTLHSLTSFFALSIPSVSLIVLAAILASIDPTAIQASVEHIRFVHPLLRDIALSEGALNDVVGVILARFFIVASISAGAAYSGLSVSAGLASMTTQAMIEPLALEIIWGVLVGLLGYFILKTWGASVRSLHWSDLALFSIIPVFCFALGSFVGGAGFLAAFIAGLLFEVREDVAEVRAFFDSLVHRFFKPIIFILLGALVPLSTLSYLLPLGVAAALVFMVVIRPLVVYVSLLPWMLKTGGSLISWREALFLSFVRETGAVSAVLLLLAVALGLAASEVVLVIGVWVILFTLIIEPPLTPLVAARLGVGK